MHQTLSRSNTFPLEARLHRPGVLRLAHKVAEREWRLFLTTKFDRTWKAMIRFRAKVGANRSRELMAELTSTIENIDSDQGGVAEFSQLLGPEQFVAYQVDLLDAVETGSDPGAFWAR